MFKMNDLIVGIYKKKFYKLVLKPDKNGLFCIIKNKTTLKTVRIKFIQENCDYWIKQEIITFLNRLVKEGFLFYCFENDAEYYKAKYHNIIEEFNILPEHILRYY